MVIISLPLHDKSILYTSSPVHDMAPYFYLLTACLCILIVYLFFAIRKISDLKAKNALSEGQKEILGGRMEALEKEKAKLEGDLAELRREHASTIEARSRLEAETGHLKTRLTEEQERRKDDAENAKRQYADILKQLEANFKVAAGEIMKTQVADMRLQNQEHLGKILDPLKENIERFRHDVNQCYNEEAKQRHTLQERIKDLIEANNSIGREARELATALRGNTKKQGDWGEMILETILEHSGLRKGEEFVVQAAADCDGTRLTDSTGRGLRPDVVVNCPDGKCMVIDSKVSLTAYVDYVNAESEEERERFGRMHLDSVRKHIEELNDKSYQDYVGKEKLDFVMMFMPNEGAFAAAMSLDPGLWMKAYDKRVLIVSPTQLTGTLRLIKQLWVQDAQSRHSREIAKSAGDMYDKFVGFVADMQNIDKGLAAVRKTYDSAINKLATGKGNLIRRAEALRKMGVAVKKKLPVPEGEEGEKDEAPSGSGETSGHSYQSLEE